MQHLFFRVARIVNTTDWRNVTVPVYLAFTLQGLLV
jgi:hypothetical protein